MPLSSQETPKLKLVRDTGHDKDTLAFISASQIQLPAVLLSLLDQSDDCVKVLSTDGHLSYMSCNGREAMEIEDFSAVQGRLWWDLWPDDGRDTVRSSVLTAASGRSVRFEGFCPTAKGQSRWWDVSVSPLRDPRGQICALLSTSRNITVRRKNQQSLETVALEMRHRLRNAYAVSAALAELSGRTAPEHRAFAKELAGRFLRLGLAQGRILDAGSEAERLPRLLEALVGVFDEAKATLVVGTLPDIPVPEQPARAIALALGELCTNSMKYGALRNGGTIALRGESVGAVVMLRWSEAIVGVRPPSSDPNTGGSGSGFLLLRKMVEAHSGRLEGQWTPDGLG